MCKQFDISQLCRKGLQKMEYVKDRLSQDTRNSIRKQHTSWLDGEHTDVSNQLIKLASLQEI